MTNSSMLETSGDGRNDPALGTNAGTMSRYSRADDAPLLESAGCLAADADVIRMTPPIAAA